VIAERQTAALAKVWGAKDVTVPTFEGEKDRLDRLLDDQPRRNYPPEQAALIAALGLRG